MASLQERARENQVKKKVEEALRSKMKEKALKECNDYVAKYAECAKGRTISVAWRCRQQANELNECLHQYTNDSVLEDMRRNYILEQEPKATDE
ncbi:unnamed protein product [Victoria cruziana]